MGEAKETNLKPYLSPAGAWALSIGTSIGWGSFVITGNTYLLKGGPLGSLLGLLIGAAVMLIIAHNYHFMANRCPDAGGAYSYCKNVFGFDYGYLTAWFLGLTYISVFWANVTSLPLFTRYFLGDWLQVGFRYTVFGYQISLGEILLCILAVILTGFICTHSRKFVAVMMVFLAGAFTIAIIVTFIFAFFKAGDVSTLNPGFVPERSEVAQILRIACISPWAFIGFENISNSTEEFGFNTKKLFRILTVSIVFTTLLYILVILLSVTAYPARYENWFAYIKDLNHLKDMEALPAFYAAERYMGKNGVILLMIALLSLVITSLFGNMIALSRLIFSIARDEVLPKELSEVNKAGVPHRAVGLIVVISIFIPFLGRTAIGWIVDVTTLGATLIYGLVSLCTFVKAKEEGVKKGKVLGLLGIIFMSAFLIMLLLPKIFTSDSMAKESYCLFTVWALLGIFLFRVILALDHKRRRFGRSGIVWIVLMALVLFTSVEWLAEFSTARTERAMNNIIVFYGLEEGAVYHGFISTDFIESQMNKLQVTNTATTAVVAAFFALALGIIINNHGLMNKRADEHERELGEAKTVAYTDPLTGVKSKHAYSEKENAMDQRIKAGVEGNFSIVVCDINGLKQVNDTLGHKAGDELICKASNIICQTYKRSPVYRIGGDEFVVILMGQDYDDRFDLMATLNHRVEENKATGGVVIAAGMADYQSGDRSFKEVFEKADELMYARKKALKENL